MHIPSISSASFFGLLTASLPLLGMAAPQALRPAQDTGRVSCYPADQQQQYPVFDPADCGSLINAFHNRYSPENLDAHRTWFANKTLPTFYEQESKCVARVQAATPISVETFAVADVIEAIQALLSDPACLHAGDQARLTTNGGTVQLKRSSGGLSPTFWISLTYGLKNPDGSPFAILQPSLLSPDSIGFLPAIVP